MAVVDTTPFEPTDYKLLCAIADLGLTVECNKGTGHYYWRIFNGDGFVDSDITLKSALKRALGRLGVTL